MASVIKTPKIKLPCRYDFAAEGNDLRLVCTTCRRPHVVYRFRSLDHDVLAELYGRGQLVGVALAEAAGPRPWEQEQNLICDFEDGACGEQADRGCIFCKQHCSRRRCRVHR